MFNKLPSSISCVLGLVLLLSLPAAATGKEFPDLETALRAARRGPPSAKAVTPAIGAQAAAEIPVATTAALVPLARVAGAGGAAAAAGRALLNRYLAAERPEQICLLALLELPPSEANPSLAKEKLGLRERALGRGADPLVLRAYGRVATGSQVRATLEAWSGDPERQRALVQLLGALEDHHRPEKLFRSLLQTRTLNHAEERLCQTLSALIKRDADTRERALALLEKSQRQDRIAAALALAGLGRTEAVLAALERALQEPASAPNGLVGLLATRTCNPAALERIVALAKDSKTAPAALRALPRLLGYCKTASKEQRAAADRAIGAALGSADPATLVEAVNAARKLRHPELVRRLSELASNNASQVRQAAIRAVPRVMELDSSSVALLMSRFDDVDPSVANLSWQTLQRWARVSIPLNRRGLWEAWRSRNNY